MTMEPREIRKPDLTVLGVPIHCVDETAMHAYIHETCETSRKALILNVNIHCMVLCVKEPWLRSFMKEGHLVYCDGDGVRWGVRLLGRKDPPKVGFTRWMRDLAGYCAGTGLSLYFLGAKPGVAEEAAKRLCREFPKLKIAGTHHGYFEKEGPDNDAVIDGINRAGADILVVGFGMPCQEAWLRRNWQRIETHIFLPGGAVIDYAAGRLGKCPPWMIRCRIEWLFRILEDPGRLFWRYAVDIPLFFLHVLLEKMGKKYGD